MTFSLNNYQPTMQTGLYGPGYPAPFSPPQMQPGYTIPGLPLPNAYYQPLMTSPASPLSAGGPVMTAAGPLAQSIPLGPLPMVIPPPDQIAPCLFNSHIPYGYGYMSPGMTNFYNYNQAPAYPWAPQYPPPAYPYPASQQLPPQQPPPPSAQPIPPADAAKKPEDAKKPEELPRPITEKPKLTPDLVQEINTGLEDRNYETRMMAANTLSDVLEGDPDILTKPQYSQYAEALILKALKDPNSIVHQPLLMTMEMGKLNSATPKILATLNAMKKDKGMYNFEPPIIAKVLSQFAMREAENKRKKLEQPSEAEAMAAANGINPGAAPIPPGRPGMPPAEGAGMPMGMPEGMPPGMPSAQSLGPMPSGISPQLAQAMAQQRPGPGPSPFGPGGAMPVNPNLGISPLPPAGLPMMPQHRGGIAPFPPPQGMGFNPRTGQPLFPQMQPMAVGQGTGRPPFPGGAQAPQQRRLNVVSS